MLHLLLTLGKGNSWTFLQTEVVDNNFEIEGKGSLFDTLIQSQMTTIQLEKGGSIGFMLSFCVEYWQNCSLSDNYMLIFLFVSWIILASFIT